MKQKFKPILKIGAALFGIALIILACEKDSLRETEDSQNLYPRKESKVQVKTGNDVSKTAINFLKEKTGNSFRVISEKNSIALSKNDISARETVLGTVNTEKEIVVTNETNTKHTFKVETINQDNNSITNIVVVETGDATYEYFLKYNFEGGAPFNTNTIDLSQFTGTIETYNNLGELKGTITIDNGEIIARDGPISPCPDDTNFLDNETNGTSGNGSDSSVGLPGDDVTTSTGSDTSTNSDPSGGWIADEWGGCGLTWYNACSRGYSDDHDPRGSPKCSGTRNGEGTGSLVVIDCDGNALRGEEQPCSGTAGVLLVVDECFVSNEVLNANYSNYSPFNVDLSEVRANCDNIDTTSVAANAKFMCIYNKLIQSPKFKDLFLDTFGESEEFDVKFTLPDSIPNANGLCKFISGHVDPTTGQLVDIELNIQIDKSYMNASSAIAVAKTILHEAIHAYLTLKYYGCNQGAPLGIMDDVDISELLNQYHLECAPLEGQHEFMFNFLVPTMSEILEDVKDDLVPISHQQAAESRMFINEINPNIDTFGEYIHDVPWNWSEAYMYLSMVGLHQSNAYLNSIQNTPAKLENYNSYRNTIIGSFRKECMN